MANAKTFRADISKWKTATAEKLDAVARQTCQEMAFRVVMATPVDTGFLRGSWQPSIGTPKGGEGKLDPGGMARVAEAALIVSGIKPGEKFFMLNNAAYARFVEYGTSKMAGRFYVTGTVKTWPSVVAKVAADLGLAK